MQSIVAQVIKTLPSEQRKKISAFNDPVILCNLYDSHCWLWSLFKNRTFKNNLLRNLFDDYMNARSVYRALEIKKGISKEIGYFYVSDLATLLMPMKEHIEKVSQNYSKFLRHFLKMCSAMKNETETMPGYRPLVTQNVAAALPPLGSTANIPLRQKNVICKFHIPRQYVWYVFEGEVEPEKGYRFFGIMEDDGMELRHFYLAELLTLIEMGLSVQLDTSTPYVPYYIVQGT